jgi:hypothetical protein
MHEQALRFIMNYSKFSWANTEPLVAIFPKPGAGSPCCAKLNIADHAELRQDPRPPSWAMMVGWGGGGWGVI